MAINASIGISIYPDDADRGDELSSLIKHAEEFSIFINGNPELNQNSI